MIDSQTACGGEGLVTLAAAAAARAGADGAGGGRPGAARPIELKMWFSLDTLEYLRRGGRIGGAQAWLGSALSIKPILTVEAEITPVERVRTSRRAFERMVDLMRERAQAGADAWMVQHIHAPDVAEKLVDRGPRASDVTQGGLGDRSRDRCPCRTRTARGGRAAGLLPAVEGPAYSAALRAACAPAAKQAPRAARPPPSRKPTTAAAMIASRW